MITVIKVTVSFDIPEEWELAEQFKKDNPEYLELEPDSNAVHFQYHKILFQKKEHQKEENK